MSNNLAEITVEQLQAEIEARIRHAETGEQWAEICRLEAEMVDMMRKSDGGH